MAARDHDSAALDRLLQLSALHCVWVCSAKRQHSQRSGEATRRLVVVSPVCSRRVLPCGPLCYLVLGLNGGGFASGMGVNVCTESSSVLLSS